MPLGPGLGRRLGAVGYDAILLVAVWFVATAALLPFSGGQAIAPGQGWYEAYLLAVAFGYFGWFWTHGGQTLGMRSWRLRLVGDARKSATWGQALLRFAGACVSWLVFGAGFLWVLVDRQGLAWHDHISGTRIADTS